MSSAALNDGIVHLVLASSPFFTVFPFVVLGLAYQRLTPLERSQCKVELSTLALVLPFAFGLTMALVYRLTEAFIPRKIRDVYARFVISGGITGLLMSIVLSSLCNVHEHWLKLCPTTIGGVHVLVGLFYTVLFYTVGQWLRGQILYGPKPAAPTQPKYSTPVLRPPSVITTPAQPSSSPSGGNAAFDAMAAKAKA